MYLANRVPNTYLGSTVVNGGTLYIQLGNAGVTSVPGTLIIGDGVGTDWVIVRSSNRIADTSDVILNTSGMFLLDHANHQRAIRGNETIGSLSMTGGTVSTIGQGIGTLTVLGT